MESYSQVGQDKWVLSLFPKGYKGFFVDIGCYLPDNINNTLLLEKHGWDGISFDIADYSKQWSIRETMFVCCDALSFDFADFGLPYMVDYLSLDIDAIGANYKVLKNLIDSWYIFKAITIEHNLYLGEQYNQAERMPQRELLLSKGYTLARADVETEGCDFEHCKFEDWWTLYKDKNSNL